MDIGYRNNSNPKIKNATSPSIKNKKHAALMGYNMPKPPINYFHEKQYKHTISTTYSKQIKGQTSEIILALDITSSLSNFFNT